MIKIVYTILGTFNSGGMERVLANKSNYFSDRGYDITVVTTDQKERIPYFNFNDQIKHIDLDINYTDDLQKGFFQRGISYYKKQQKHRQRLKELLFKIKPDITISMFDNDASFITDINDSSKKVLEIHFSRFKRLQYGRKGFWKLIDSYRNKSDLKTVKKFDRFIVLTEEDKGYWGELSNIQVIPNANSFQTERKSALDNKQVVAIGRFDYQKGFDELIEIWSKVYGFRQDWKLKIYGHGPLKDQFQELINVYALQDSIELKEPTKNIIEVYMQSSILAMTSRYEGLPMVLLEAQVCGLPMVSYTCKCGPRDIITNEENGFLVGQGDQELMVEKLLYLMNEDQVRKKMGESSYQNSINFSEAKIMEKWEKLFNDLGMR